MSPEPAAAEGRVARPVVLVTGGTGQVGYELVRLLAPLGQVVAPDRRDLDLSCAESIRALVRHLRPRAIVNAAAYTAVDRAESEPALCSAINTQAPRVLAEEAARVDAALVHYSTDYVFDGTKAAPYTEEDAPNPLNVYGESKLAGERAVAEVGGGHLIIRTTWVYGARGMNFLRTVRRLARERRELRIVRDQIGAPTWSRAIALASTLLLHDVLTSDRSPTAVLGPAAGIYHLTAAGATSWYEFACAILEHDPQRAEYLCERVIPISSGEFPTPARRPAYSVLDNAKLSARFGLALPDWREQLRLVLDDLTG